jgi:hypothetical protein
MKAILSRVPQAESLDVDVRLGANYRAGTPAERPSP